MVNKSAKGSRDVAAAQRAWVEAALRRQPKMPPAQQKRLDELLERGSEGKLSKRERTELKALLDEVDRQTMYAAARVALELEDHKGRAGTARRRRTEAAANGKRA